MLEDLSRAARESGNLKGDKMADGGVSHAEAAGAVLRYESFLNDVLKRDLALVQARREREEEALEAYEKLKGEAARFEAMAKGEGTLAACARVSSASRSASSAASSATSSASSCARSSRTRRPSSTSRYDGHFIEQAHSSVHEAHIQHR